MHNVRVASCQANRCLAVHQKKLPVTIKDQPVKRGFNFGTFLNNISVRSCKAAQCSPTDQHDLEVEDNALTRVQDTPERKVKLIVKPNIDGKRAIIEGEIETGEGEERGRMELSIVVVKKGERPVAVALGEVAGEEDRGDDLGPFEWQTGIYHCVLALIAAVSLLISVVGGQVTL